MKILALSVGLLCSMKLDAQVNFVSNPDFETYSACGGPITNAPPWLNPTAGTPDYYNACSATYSVPVNSMGTQQPRSGNGYGALYAWARYVPEVREYIQILLNDTLIAGKVYCVSFYTSLSDSSQYAVDGMGAYFSANPISSTNYYVLNYTPQINHPSGVFLNDYSNWMQVSGTFIANGNERYMTIGNFKDDANTDSLFCIGGSTSTWSFAYYYIDDVSVTDCGWSGIGEKFSASAGIIFPNPATGVVNVKLDNADENYYWITLFSISGQVMLKTELRAENGKLEKTIDISQLEQGIYFISVSSGKNEFRQKLVVRN